MSDLTFLEKYRLEKLLGMGSGYILNFTNSTFSDFVVESTGRNIYDAKYDRASGSKANRLRAFWANEPNYLVGRLLADLLEYCRVTGAGQGDAALHEECARVADRLRVAAPVAEFLEVTGDTDGREFDVLARAVRDAIDRNEPEAGLDRLHTFVTKFVRALCGKRGVEIAGKPLHSLFGEYVKRVRDEGLIDSEMTERILKSSISILEAFNDVRNDQSLAHDNPVLNHDESLLIFGHVAGAIAFVRTIEDRSDRLTAASAEPDIEGDDIPF